MHCDLYLSLGNSFEGPDVSIASAGPCVYCMRVYVFVAGRGLNMTLRQNRYSSVFHSAPGVYFQRVSARYSAQVAPGRLKFT